MNSKRNTPNAGDSNLIQASVNFSGSGDNTIIAALAGNMTRVYRLAIVVGDSTQLQFKRGSTAISGPYQMKPGGSIVLDFDGEPWFKTGINEALIINSTVGVVVGGCIWYLQGRS